LVLSDALSRQAADDDQLIRCHCLAHGRRQFSDLEDVLPQECRVVIEALTPGCDHDTAARDQQMSPAARLAYHQASSQPLMDALKAWLDRQVAERLGEPHRALGQAIASMPTHGETLTRWVSVAGAPLDNHGVERAVTLCIRLRKHALFSKTADSASSARVLTSLIATCIYAGVNGLDALVALQEHRAEVCADPAAWVPWPSPARRAPP
jgi:hypothetical protein